jgi:hypothetical protein
VRLNSTIGAQKIVHARGGGRRMMGPIAAELAHRSNNGRDKRSQPRGNANQFGRQLAKAVAGKEPMVYAVTEN